MTVENLHQAGPWMLNSSQMKSLGMPGGASTPPDAEVKKLSLEPGRLVEEKIRLRAAESCLPDFVFEAEVIRKGQATREISDGILVVGRKALVIQSKARAPGLEDDELKSGSWISKNVKKALSQLEGTSRTLEGNKTTILHSMRNREFEIEWEKLDQRVGVIVIEHPTPPSELTNLAVNRIKTKNNNNGYPLLVLSRKDWDMINESIGSTNGLIDYILRAHLKPCALGEEIKRYNELAMEDNAAMQIPLERELPRGATILRVPALGSIKSARDKKMIKFFDSIMQSAALSEMSVGAKDEWMDRLALLDSVPVGIRVDFCNKLIDQMKELNSGELIGFTPENIGGRQLIFVQGASGMNSRGLILQSMEELGKLRHHENLKQVPIKDRFTLVVGIDYSSSELHFMSLYGDLNLSAYIVEKLIKKFGNSFGSRKMIVTPAQEKTRQEKAKERREAESKLRKRKKRGQ